MDRIMAPWQHLVRRLNLYLRSPAGIERQGYIMVGLCCAYPIGYTLKNLLIAPVFFSRHVIYDPNGLDAQLPEHVQAIADDEMSVVCPESKFDVKYHRVVKEAGPPCRFYLTPKMEPISCGLTSSSPGAHVALPLFVTFTTPEDARQHIHQLTIALGGGRSVSVDAESAASEQLVGTMILSDCAKRFLIRRELERRSSKFTFFLPMFEWLGCFGAAYGATTVLSGPVGFIASAVGTSLIALLAFVGISRKVDAVVDLLVDEDTAAISSYYQQGAIECLEKSLRRNRIVRKLLGTEGCKYYTEKGDFFNSPTLSLTMKLKAIQQVQVKKSSDDSPSQSS